MNYFPPTIVIRHRKENLKKCSLRGLENRSDFQFFSYPLKTIPSFENYILLTIDAPEILSEADKRAGLLLLDGTWRYAQVMEKVIPDFSTLKKRRLPPNILTAYPRRQQDCPDPSFGLASVEALAVAYLLLGRKLDGLLDHYHWKDAFLAKNSTLSIFHH